MLLRGGGWGAPGNRCAAIAERAAVPGPIEHAGEPTAIAAIILAPAAAKDGICAAAGCA